jgi:zinc transport system substrate-binding protein
MTKKTVAALSAATASIFALTACAATPSSDETAELTVAAAFYPIEFLVESIGGPQVTVISVTPPGVEPHDIELSPAAVRELGAADLAIYLADFQPAVDDAIATTGVKAMNAADFIDLRDAADDHADEEHADEAEEDADGHGTLDPHFWLDPQLLAEFAGDINAEFALLAPDFADEFNDRTEALLATLSTLDESYSTGLAQCERREIFVSHEAFGYLTERFDLQQEGIAGLDPETEPSPARVLEIADLIAEHGATTIFTESLVSAGVAEALASDAGVETAVLDPVEGVTDGDDYISVMERNLEALRAGLDCS